MDTSPSSAALKPSGSAAVSVETSASSTPTSLDTDAAEVAAASTTPLDIEPEEFEYEFSGLWEGHLYFVHVVDTNILSATQRVLNTQHHSEITQDKITGNWFVHYGGFSYTIKKQPYKRSFTVPDCKPLPEELTKRKPVTKMDSVLEGLM